MGTFWKNVVTLGAHGRIENEKKIFEQLLAQVSELNNTMEVKKAQLNQNLLGIVKIKKKAIYSLKKISRITKKLKPKDRVAINMQVGNKKEEINIAQVELSLDLGLTAINAGKGASAGLATATSAYFLVGNLAAASTGTAISTLSGVAASNATLAWLGGGSLAAGGGGMAAGSMVMGGLIAIPAIAVMGLLNHLSANKEIKKIKERELEAYQLMDEIKKNILAFDLTEARVREVGRAIEKSREVFNREFKDVYKKIYPIVFISRFIKWVRKLFGYEYFDKYDLKNIAYILQISTGFAKLIDTRLIEDSTI